MSEFNRPLIGAVGEGAAIVRRGIGIFRPAPLDIERLNAGPLSTLSDGKRQYFQKYLTEQHHPQHHHSHHPQQILS